MCIYIWEILYPMDISCLDNHLPTWMHPQLTTSTLFFTRRISSTCSPDRNSTCHLQCQNPADTATAFSVQRETDLPSGKLT